jgi:hypothetical protein
MKDLSWIEEAWHYSREADQEDLLTTINEYYEYRKNTGIDSDGQSEQQGSAQRSGI